MNRSRFNLFHVLKAAALKWNSDNCVRLGASLSYYTLFSLFPLILVVLTIIRLILANSDDAQALILDALSSVTGGFRDDFLSALDAAQQTRSGSGIVGSVTLVLGATWVFGELVSAFNIIWGLEAPSRGGPLQFLRATFFSFALVLSGAFLLLASMIISALLAALAKFMQTLPGGVTVWGVAQIGINLCVLTLIFALLFKYLPQTYVAWRDVWLGAMLTAVLWSLLQFAISYYIALSSYKNYGAVGSILALVAWVYLSSQVIFFGGEFTSVYACEYGSRADVAFNARRASAQMPATIISSPKPKAEPDRERIVSGATGVVVGAIGTIFLAIIALLVGLGRQLRRLRSG
ncbi:MAG: YihY/virulence factor BrkB family protein [Chloroflexi bacterium]|nr:YihY/virulence factor BrkB family protein [Chloroflexota bacterium]